MTVLSLFLFLKDGQISEGVKRERLEKLLRDEINETDFEPHALVSSGTTLTPLDPHQSNISLRELQDPPTRSNP